MTQKELLYFEDAIMHEKNTIKIIDLFLNQLENKNLIDFMKMQRKKHEKMQTILSEKLEAKCNE